MDWMWQAIALGADMLGLHGLLQAAAESKPPPRFS